MSPGLNELTNLSGKALYVHILLTLTGGNFMEFPLKGSQLINPSDYVLNFLFNNCPVSRHSLCRSLVDVPQCPTPRDPCGPRAIFAPLAAGQAK